MYNTDLLRRYDYPLPVTHATPLMGPASRRGKTNARPNRRSLKTPSKICREHGFELPWIPYRYAAPISRAFSRNCCASPQCSRPIQRSVNLYLSLAQTRTERIISGPAEYQCRLQWPVTIQTVPLSHVNWYIARSSATRPTTKNLDPVTDHSERFATYQATVKDTHLHCQSYLGSVPKPPWAAGASRPLSISRPLQQ